MNSHIKRMGALAYAVVLATAACQTPRNAEISDSATEPNGLPNRTEVERPVRQSDVKRTDRQTDDSLTLETRARAGNEEMLRRSPSNRSDQGRARYPLATASSQAKTHAYDRAVNYAPSPVYQAPFNAEQYAIINENGFHFVRTEPLSTFASDVDAASYANVRRFLNNGQLPPVDAVRIEELVNYFRYDDPAPRGRDPIAIRSEVGTCPWNSRNRLVRIGIKAREIQKENRPANNLVFLIDVSGSMQSPDKLPLLQKAFRLLVNELNGRDTVSIVVYAGNAGLVLPPTPGNRKSQILGAIDRLRAGGSTAGGAGIHLAYDTAMENVHRRANTRVILATDGDFNVGVSGDDELVRLIESRRDQGIYLTVLGFGTGNLKDSKMEKIADHGNGHYAYIDSLQEAQKVLVAEMGGTLNTVAKDVKIQVEFNPARVEAYRLVGYENRLLAPEDFNDDRKDAGDMGAGHTVTALYEIVPTGRSSDHPSVDPLKYQPWRNDEAPSHHTGEWLTVKFRYKHPQDTRSHLISRVVEDQPESRTGNSDDFRFAAAVAAWGQLLRRSEHAGQMGYEDVVRLARESRSDDRDGYRAEFVRLVQLSAQLDGGDETARWVR